MQPVGQVGINLEFLLRFLVFLGSRAWECTVRVSVYTHTYVHAQDRRMWRRRRRRRRKGGRRNRRGTWQHDVVARHGLVACTQHEPGLVRWHTRLGLHLNKKVT